MLCKKISVFLFKVYSLIFLSIIFSSCSNIVSKTERLDTDVLKYPPREYEMRKRMKEEGRETLISNLFGGERKKKKNAQKCKKTMDLIGCSTSKLMNHLESKFQLEFSTLVHTPEGV